MFNPKNMAAAMEKERFIFWTRWTFHHTWVILVSYIVNLILVLILAGLFGISMAEMGTWEEQFAMQLAGTAVFGLGVGLLQRSLLREILGEGMLWPWKVVGGFILAEVLAALICLPLQIDPMRLRFIEGNALPEVLVFTMAGLIIGFLQWFQLKKHYRRSFSWVPLNALGWGLCLLVMYLPQLIPALNHILTLVLLFSLGATLYGALTGLMWLQKRD